MNDARTSEGIPATGPIRSRLVRSPVASRSSRPWLIPLLTAGVVLTAAFLTLWLTFGSIPVGLRYLRGERLILWPDRLNAGILRSTEPVVVSAEVRNYSGVPVRLIGAATPCTCVMTQEALPTTIPAGGSLRLPLQVRAVTSKPVVDETVVIYTDNEERPQLRVNVRAQVLTSAPHAHLEP